MSAAGPYADDQERQLRMLALADEPVVGVDEHPAAVARQPRGSTAATSRSTARHPLSG